MSVDASTLVAQANLFLSPSAATIVEGSTIQIPVFVNTEGRSINTVSLSVNFDPSKLVLVNPSNANSIIGIWVDPPTYSNTKGTLELSGVIPNGITTQSGLITTMTFRAVTSGQTTISISDASQVLANDGQGTAVKLQFNRGSYTILPQSPNGPAVFSETHPFQDTWYNNNSPVLAWNRDPGVTAFSFTLDNKPFTIPDNAPDATDTVIAYPNLTDGIWYFHIKAQKAGIWGGTTNFVIRIDTTPPADFTPTVQTVTSSGSTQALISFFTTDALSGLDHYEVSVIDPKASGGSSAFVEAQSPYQLSLKSFQNVRVTVRAFDKAGNVKDETINVTSSLTWITFFEQNWLIILLLLFLLIHYFFGHRIISRVKKITQAAKEDELEEKNAATVTATLSLEAKQKRIKEEYLKNLETLSLNQAALLAQSEAEIKEYIKQEKPLEIPKQQIPAAPTQAPAPTPVIPPVQVPANSYTVPVPKSQMPVVEASQKKEEQKPIPQLVPPVNQQKIPVNPKTLEAIEIKDSNVQK